MLDDLWTSFLAWTGQFVVPDWGSLIKLIPLGLAGIVFLYVTWTVFRFATAAPTRRGTIRKLPPRTPEGIHMPGPSFAPILAAFGTFMLMFGMVSGGLWLPAGLAVLAITLLYWGREALRDYDHAAGSGTVSTAGGAGAAMAIGPGALTAPRGTPPEGVHMPPPSFRPLVVSLSLTILVAGLIFGGAVLVLGIVAVAVALIGWLRDSGREYAATEAADQTGHLDLGGAPAWPVPVFAALALIIAGALLLGSGVLSRGGSTATGGPAASGAAAAAGSTGGGAAAAPSLPAADVTLAAQNIAFVQTSLEAPAGKAFTIAFDNLDTAPHNVQISDASGASVFKGDIVNGPAVKVYDVPALPAGQYSFVCLVHPSMTGTLTVK
jgi:plastocyanin